MGKYRIIFIICCFFAINNSYSKKRIALDNNLSKCFTVQTIESNSDNYIINVQFHGFYDTVSTISDIEYHRISIDSCYTLSNIGEPALPVLTKSIALPKGCTYVVELANEKWAEFPMGYIYPFQKPLLETEKEPSFTINKSIYESDIYISQTLHWTDKHYWRGIENINLALCPFKYYPAQQKLSALKECTIKVRFISNNVENRKAPNTLGNELKLYDNENLFSQEIKNMSASKDNSTYDLLIISCNNTGILNSQALKDFCLWKSLKGIKTKLVSTASTGTTCTEIKNFISQEYQHGIKYVLFIGDDDDIPLYDMPSITYSGITKSDYWYGCMDGSSDVVADIAIGRFSTKNLSELTNIVNKIKKYESTYNPYYNKVLLMANKEEAPNKYQGCLETIRNATYQNPMTFTTAYGAPTSAGGNNSTNADVINHVNSGLNILNYRGHGNENSWTYWNESGEYFYGSNVENFSTPYNFIVFSIACYTGNIRNNTCMLEKFMNSSKGSVAFLGATEASYTISNHTFNQYLFKQLLNEKIYNFGLLNIASHIKNLEYTNYSSTSKDNAFCYLCGGDPSLEIWTSNPQTFQGITITTTSNGTLINTKNVNGCCISIVSEEGELLNNIEMSGNNYTIPTLPTNCYIAINKHDYIPYIYHKMSDDIYIQNVTFNQDATYNNQGTVYIGYDVTNDKEHGNVIIKNGKTLKITNASEVIIKNGFECEKGATFIVE